MITMYNIENGAVGGKCLTFPSGLLYIVVSLLWILEHEQIQTRLLWLCNQTGLKYTEERPSLSDVRSKMEETLSGSMNGEQPAQKNLQIRMNTESDLLLHPTVETTGVRAETNIRSILQQTGVIPSNWQYHTVSHITFLSKWRLNGSLINMFSFWKIIFQQNSSSLCLHHGWVLQPQ